MGLNFMYEVREMQFIFQYLRLNCAIFCDLRLIFLKIHYFSINYAIFGIIYEISRLKYMKSHFSWKSWKSPIFDQILPIFSLFCPKYAILWHILWISRYFCRHLIINFEDKSPFLSIICLKSAIFSPKSEISGIFLSILAHEMHFYFAHFGLNFPQIMII